MNLIVATAIRDAERMKANSHPGWARVIAEALVDTELSAAMVENLMPIIAKHFPRFAETDDPNGVIADILSESPILADRAAVALSRHGHDQPPVAVMVDLDEPGQTWFSIYDDQSLLDPYKTPWFNWRDFIDEELPFDQEGARVYLTPCSEVGDRIAPEVRARLADLGYTVE